MQIIHGLFGIVFLLLIAYLFSTNRKAINFRTVITALIIHFFFALIVLKWKTGIYLLEQASNGMNEILGFANQGIDFVFGGFFEAENIGMVFAIQVLTPIIFFSSLISVLYYLGIMQWIIKIIGGFLSFIMKTTKAESMSATANIFVGCTEAPLVIKPYIRKMTESELFAVMVSGLTSVAGSVLIGYSLLGIPMQYLITASFLSAPASLLFAKILIPETNSRTNVLTEEFTFHKDDSVNVIDAAASGAAQGLKLTLNIAAILIAFIGLIALVNGVFGWLSGFLNQSFTLELIFGYLFAPVAFIIGMPWSEALIAGEYLGIKLILNEFVAFSYFGAEIDNFTTRSTAIITFALCGFSSFMVIGILIAGLGGIAPERRGDVSRLGLKALLGGVLGNLLNATVAGMLII